MNQSLLAVLVSASTLSTAVNADDGSLEALLSMSLEELTMLDVSMETASKSSQKLTDIPASVYVLSGERVVRSGASNITEALALIPGMYVSKSSENSYFVSSRGFHDGLYNKLLVMVDGRSIYSPVYGGVYWTTLDYILADIDRIEVLRGPSGAIWGGNAVNGVINIITKSPEDTQGTYLSGTTGRYDAYDVSLRHGFQVDDNIYARVFYKGKSNPNELSNSSEKGKTDSAGFVVEKSGDMSSWQFRAGGLRDTYDADIYTLHLVSDEWGVYPESESADHVEVKSTQAFVQFSHQLQMSNGDQLSTAMWIEHVKDTDINVPGDYTTFDLDLNYQHLLSEDHTVRFGGGFRHMYLDFSSDLNDFDPYNPYEFATYYDVDEVHDSIGNAFVQSEKWWNEHWLTVVGVKAEYFEQNDTFELSPQARVMYQLNDVHSFWAGIGRAVVTPSYLESDSYFASVYESSGNYFVDQYIPNDSLDNESVLTVETGYRFTPMADFDLDSTVFYSEHSNLRSFECNPALSDMTDPHLSYCETSDDYSAKTYGIELATHYSPLETLDIFASYSYLRVDSHWEGRGSAYSTGESTDYLNVSFSHLASLQVLWNITDTVQWDMVVKYNNTEIPDNEYYDNDEFDPLLTVDTRIGWQKSQHAPLIEVIVQKVGQDEEYDSWLYYPNEELVYVRLSHEF